MLAKATSPNPAKAAVERAWLLYSPVWMISCAAVMLTQIGESWADWEFIIFSTIMALGCFIFPLLVFPLVRNVASSPLTKKERLALAQKCAQSSQATYKFKHGSKKSGEASDMVMEVSPTRFIEALIGKYTDLVTFSFALNYFQTPFFFDVLHMRFGFNVTWVHDRNPFFCYLLTVAYFSTYDVLATHFYRLFFSSQRGPASTTGISTFVRSIIGMFITAAVIAFLETATNANPFMARLFCYDDLFLVLTFGSACYGIALFFATPLWLWWGAVPDEELLLSVSSEDVKKGHAEAAFRLCPKSIFRKVVQGVAGFVVICVVDRWLLDLVKVHVAPSFTTVIDDSPAFGGCLQLA